jgi:hypothetical protein
MKKIISKNIERLDLETNIDNLIRELQDYKVQYSDYENLRINIESNYEGSDDHYLRGDRMETDEEEKLRLSREESAERKNTEFLRKQYEALKAKFEK